MAVLQLDRTRGVQLELEDGVQDNVEHVVDWATEDLQTVWVEVGRRAPSQNTPEID